MATEAAENEFRGHYNLKGEKPYHRYAFAGGTNHITENAAAAWTSGSFTVTDNTILEQMQSAHAKFMNERAPNDGHKQNCIDKGHNYVGIGYYMSDKQFRYYEEFINQYIDFGAVPLTANQIKRSPLRLQQLKILFYTIW